MFLVFVMMLLVAGCAANNAANNKGGAPGVQQAQAAPVFTSKAIKKSVPVEIQAVGNVEAYSTVSVKAQIGGQLTLVDFTEGSDVKKGDRLFVIDPRPYEAQVAQASAALERDKAQLQMAQANVARDTAQEDYARAQAKRFSELTTQGIIPRDSSEQTDAQAKAASESVRADRAAIQTTQANLAADQAALDRAKLDLEYCTIRSPIDGRTGHLTVKQGNVVKANDVELVTINQLRPIYISFTVPETELPPIKAQLAAGKVSVEAFLQGDDAAGEKGRLTFIENTVDRSTGTINLKATFDNPSAKLWPGQFARVVVRLNASADTIVIPTTAVQTGQDGKFVFVVKPDMTVEARPVIANRALDRDVVVEKGLNEGEIVVTSGQLRLVQGSHVQVQTNP